MRARLIGIVGVALLAACASRQPPEWQAEEYSELEQFKQHYLEGDTRRAARNFAHAKADVAATGRLDLAARIELIRCAVGTAALDLDACAGFEAVQADAPAEDKAYAAFLAGRWENIEAGKLPPNYRSVAGARDEQSRNRAMKQIEDPISRLIAAGALFRIAQLSPEGLSVAIDTASAQGFRRPLLAYLNVQAKRAEAAGDAAALDVIRRRIELVTKQ